MSVTFTPTEVANRWKVSERHIRRMIRDGQLKAFRLGGKLLRITEAAVEELECRGVASSSTGECGASTGEKPADLGAARLARLTAREPNKP
jgi:excisionase family DNA binding protein